MIPKRIQLFDQEHTPRVGPEMSSRKLIALDFIKRYYASWGHSPTYGEIAAVLGVSRQRAHGLVHELAMDKMIEVVAGKARGIRLPNRAEELSVADVLVRMVELGWAIGNGNVLIQPENGPPITNAVALLDHPPLTTSGLPRLDHPADKPQPTGGTSGKGTIGETSEKIAPSRRAKRRAARA